MYMYNSICINKVCPSTLQAFPVLAFLIALKITLKQKTIDETLIE